MLASAVSSGESKLACFSIWWNGRLSGDRKEYRAWFSHHPPTWSKSTEDVPHCLTVSNRIKMSEYVLLLIVTGSGILPLPVTIIFFSRTQGCYATQIRSSAHGPTPG